MNSVSQFIIMLLLLTACVSKPERVVRETCTCGEPGSTFTFERLISESEVYASKSETCVCQYKYMETKCDTF